MMFPEAEVAKSVDVHIKRRTWPHSDDNISLKGLNVLSEPFIQSLSFSLRSDEDGSKHLPRGFYVPHPQEAEEQSMQC